MQRAGAFILAPLGPGLSAEESDFFRQTQPWGFILFARNIQTPEQLRALTATLRDAVGRDAPILIDQEGGRVQRLRPPHWREWLPPLDEVERAGINAERVLFLRSALIGAELRDVGIDVDCAPMADIAEAATHPFLRNRCYGQTVADVTARARAVADGLMAGGCLPVVKHMPGHGRATVDSHLHLPRVTDSHAALSARDFAPFTALAGLPMAMTAHIVFEAIDPDAPATCSPAMMQVIRDEIGFGGLLMSDDISMQALSGGVADRSRAAISAGCDLVLHCNGDLAEMRAVADACGGLTDRAAGRAAAALAQRPQAPILDIAAAEVEFRALTGQ